MSALNGRNDVKNSQYGDVDSPTVIGTDHD